MKVFCKKGVLRNFAKIIGKRLCQRFFFNKVAGLGLFFFVSRLMNGARTSSFKTV